MPYSYLYLFGLIPGLLSSVLVGIFPVFRRPVPALLLAFLSAIVFFRREFPAVLVQVILIWILIRCIGRIPAKHPRNRAMRWRYAALLLTAFSGSFLLTDLFLKGGYFRAFGVTWIIYGHQMMLFLRLISLIWEFGVGRVIDVPLRSYFEWVFFPCTLGILIWRFSDYQKQYPLKCSDERPPLPKWCRWLGALACLQIAGAVLLQNWMDRFASGSQRSLAVQLSVIFFAGPWMLYLLAAGATNAMRSLGCFWNVELPPGYERPYGRVNISEYWAHFNMSATYLFRDMLFYNRWGMKKLNPYINSVVVFSLIGLWHGSNLQRLSWGVLNGLGFAAFLWWRSRPQLSGFSVRLGLPPRVAQFGSAAFTYVFICSCDYVATQISLSVH